MMELLQPVLGWQGAETLLTVLAMVNVQAIPGVVVAVLVAGVAMLTALRGRTRR